MNNLKVRSKLFFFENIHRRIFSRSKEMINISGLTSNIKHAVLLAIALIAFSSVSFGQAVGDYQTNATGAWNWNTVANWQRCVSAGTWVGATSTDYPGQLAGAGAVTILNNTNVTLNVSPANVIGTLTINTGANNSSIVFSGANSLTVTGATTINGSGTNAINKFIDVAAGAFTTASISMTDGGGDTRDCYLSISTGSATISGDITMAGSNLRNYILFSNTGIVNIGGTITGGTITSTAGGGAAAPTSGTISYNGAGAQNIGNYAYFNLATATGGIKTLPNAAIAVGGTLAVNNSTLAFTNAAAQVITVTGNLSGNGTIDMSSGSQTHTLNLGGATNAIGTLTTAAVASTINYNSAGAQTVFASPNYRNLTISVGGTKTLQGNITVNNDLTVNTSTLDFGGTLKTVDVLGNLSGSGTISMIGAGIAHTLNLGGTNNAITTFTTTAASGSTVNYNRAGDQQVFTSINYRNLTISVSGIKTFQGVSTVNNNLNVSGGTLNLGTGAWTHTITGNAQIDGTLSFNGVGVKTLNITGNLSGAGILDMSTLTHTLNLGGATNAIGTLTTTAVASTINYNSAGVQTVFASPNYRNLTISNGGTKTLQGDATIGGNLNITAGIFDLGATATAVNITGNATITGTLTFGIIAKIVSLTGDLSGGGFVLMTGAGLAHTFNLGGTNNAIATFTTTALSGSTVNYNRNGDQQVFASANYRNLTISIGGIKTFQGASTINNDLNVSGGTLNLGGVAYIHNVLGNAQIDGTLSFNGVGIKTLNVTGNLSGAGILDMSTLTHTLNLGGANNAIGTLTTTAVASVINYNRAGAQTVFSSPNYRTLTISGGNNKSLLGNITVGGTLTLTAGFVQLGNFDLTIANGATAPAGGVTNMVITNGTGQLKKVFPAGASAFTFPVGDLTVSNDYSPTTITYTTNSTIRTIGVKVTDSQHPSDFTITDFISRYWSFTDDQAGTYTYTPSFSYSAAAPTDLTGTYANLRVNRWGGSWTQYTTTTAGAPTIVTSAVVSETTGPLNGADFTGRENGPTTYNWNQTGVVANWTTPSNWTPSRFSPQPTDILVFDNNGTTTATNVPTQTINRLTISNTSNVTLQSAAAVTLTINNGTGTDLVINPSTVLSLGTTVSVTLAAGATATVDGTLTVGTGTTYTTNGASTITTVAGTVNNSGTITSTLTGLIFNASSIYNHTGNGGVIPTATWNTTSTINVTGTTNTAVTGLNQTFGNLNFNCLALTSFSTATLGGATIVQGNFSIAGTSAAFRFVLQLAGQNFTVNGTTNINAFGIIDDNNNAGLNTFNGVTNVNATGLFSENNAAGAGSTIFIGNVNILANGSWTITLNPVLIFRGGLTYNASSFTSGGGNYIFDTNNQSISGGQSLTITGSIVTTGFTLTNQNTAGLTCGAFISGTGNFINGDATYNAILYLTGGGNPFSLAGTLTLNANPNTVNYAAGVAQTIGAYNFYNLTASGAGTRTLVNGGTVGIAGLFTPVGAYVITNNTVDFNGTIAQNIPAFTFNNLTISGNSTKTLSGNVAVGAAGILNLNTAILELANFNLTISNNAVGAITGAFGSSNMISTNGTGYLVKNAATGQPLFPVGSGTYYSPFTLTAIAPVGGTVGVRAVTPFPLLNPSYIKKYWDITNSVARTSATATFQYDAAELNGASQSIAYSPNSGTTWQNPPASGLSSFVGNSFTITTHLQNIPLGVPSALTGWWTMGNRTFYSYQTGDWSTATTWTSDPSGTLQIGSTIPGYNDKVVILTSRTVTISSPTIATQNLDITIDAGGFLNMGTSSFTNPLLGLRGQGTLQLATANLPTVAPVANNTLVLSGGGTVEYNNTADFTLPVLQTNYNNLTINTSAGIIATQFNNLTLSGNLYIKQGIFRINDNASVARREISISGNVTVDATGEIAVGTGNTNQGSPNTPPFMNYYDQVSHRVVVYGDFTNSGKVRFTNLAFPIYNVRATNGYATVYFQGLTNNTLSCNGQTDFYNLILDKGTDQTYKLTVNPSAYGNFRLFGANYSGGDQVAPATASNPNIYKALWIRNGSLYLTGFTVIPSLTEGTGGGPPNGDYFIPANGALVLDNPNVIVLVTADDYQEVNAAYGVAGGTGQVNGVLNTGSLQALSLYGTVQVNDGYLSTRESAGIVTWNVASGQVVLNGGVIDAKQLRSGGGGAGKSSYLQSGGMFILRGRFQRTPTAFTTPTDLSDYSITTLNTSRVLSTIDGTVGTFSLIDPSNVFSMTGGTIRIYDVCGGGGRLFDVFSSSGNQNVTGGTLEINPITGTVIADAATWLMSSYAPLYNITIDRLSSTSIVQNSSSYAGYTASPLVILNNLTLNTAVLNANSLNVKVGGNFSVSLNSTYTPGTNMTIFNGSGAQSLSVNTAATLAFKKFKVDKPAGTVLTLAGTQPTISVADSLMIVKGTLADGGKTIDFVTSGTTTTSYIFNSGIHSGAGKIRLSDDDPQVIDGDGLGIFGNFELNNTDALAAPISLTSNITLNGALTFSQPKLFNIKTYNLKLNSTASIVGADATHYIQTSGTLGDGGITRVYPNSTAFIFPLGAASTGHALPAYTPASIGFTGVPTYGSITVNPVGYEHPTTTTNGRSLTYFWRVKSNGFTLGAATVTHQYTYNQNDVVTGALITEDGYVPARYNTSTLSWTRGSALDVDEAANTIGGVFLTGTGFIDGDYTAGDDTPTNPFGTSIIYYSRINGALAGNGLWSNVNTWSTVSHTGPAAAAVPGINDIVIIGAKDSVYLATDNTWPYDTDNTEVPTRSCASLQIEKGSALDIGYNTNTNFGMVLSHVNGNGNFRFTTSSADQSTYIFPAGDFTDFNKNLGTTEIYSTNPNPGTTYWLPNNIATYGNLILSPLGGSNIIFGNTNLEIYGNLITRGQNADSWFCPTWNVNYPTAPAARIAKTITIDGNLDIQGGALIWYGNAAITQNVVVNGDVKVAPNSAIDVWAAATSQNFSIGGNLINNTVGTIAGGTSTTRQCDFTLLPVTFFGNTSTSITNTVNNPVTIFDRLTVNKGSSQATTLTINIGGTLTTLVDNWLTLQNGTLKYMRTNPNSDFTISQGTAFTIPTTSGLYIDYSNTGNRNILIADAASGTNDLFLNGKLTLIRGNVYVGPIAAPNNDNDIEYSGGGSSSIDVSGGQLVVNGQIRRNVSSTVGVLSYNQTAGNVVINGNNQNSLRAKLEVCNVASSFNMSNGTLTIVRGGGTTYGDLYLRPASGSVTGGTITFTQVPTGLPAIPLADADQAYTLESNIALNHLTITGKTAATTRTATVTLGVSPLIVNGNLTLTNNRSILISNNRDITIKGDMSNTGTYTYGTNTTTFSGGAQAITGTSVTNFYDLVVSPVTSLTPSNSFTVNRNLTINSGILTLTNKNVALLGNLVNNGTYTDNNITGGVSLTGSSIQQITGTGSYGRLELNNNTGANLNNSISLQNDLVLTLGILNINQYELTLGQSSIIGGAPFSLTKMIVSDGVATSEGLRKFFGVIAAPTNFTFPVGVSGKYTPAAFTINTNATVGSINVIPIKMNHPAVDDPLNVLNYYWKIESSGVSNFDGKIVLQYLSSDVQVTGINTEADYVAAKLLIPGTYWSKAAPGSGTDNVDETLHQITFNYSAGTNNISGDYTAGINIALPDEVASYKSNKNGNWSDETIWDAIGASPPCPIGGPNGFSVIVDHDVTTNVNYCFAYQTTINGKLKIVFPTFGHNLGTVTGSGTLYLEGGNLPAGTFYSFLDCATGGTLEYGGSGNYTIIASLYNSVPNLYFTGSGTRTLPNKDLTICNRLKIDGPVLDNSVNNRKLTILGTMERYTTGTFTAGSGVNAIVSFAGSALQTVGGPMGNFSGANGFNHMEINNSLGLNIGNAGVIQLSGNLLLTNGIIKTTATNLLYLNGPSTAVPAGGSATSFVNGPLYKFLFSGSSFLYPIGKGVQKSHNFTLTNTSAGSLNWLAEYFSPNPTYASLTLPLEASNTKEYWSVKNTSGANTAKVKIGWDPASDLTPTMTVNGLPDMRVAEYSAGSWVEKLSTTSGNVNTGDVATTNNLTISTTPINYTTASVTTTKPKASLNPSGPICGAVGIPVSFSTFIPIALPYTLDYTLDGVAQPTINVLSLPYTLPTPTPGAYKLTNFTYHNVPDVGVVIGVVNPTIVNAYATPPTANAGPDQSWCSVSGTTLNGNDPDPLNDPDILFTGQWTKVSGIGGTILTPTAYNSGFNGTLGNTYTLRWTVSKATCSSYDDVVIAYNVAAQRPSNFTSAPTPVCQSSFGKIYTVPTIPAATFNWSYSGDFATINGISNPPSGITNTVNGISNSITVAYGAAATGGTMSVTATNACGTSIPRSIIVSVLTQSTITLGANPSVCRGVTTANLSYSATTGSPDQYSIVFNAAATGAGFVNVTNAALPVGSISIVVPAAAPVATYNGNLTVRNAIAGCVSVVYPISITVKSIPVATISLSPIPNSCNADPVTITYTLSGGVNYDFDLNKTYSVTTTLMEHISTPLASDTRTDNPIWLDLGSGNNSVVYTYTIINLMSNGCAGADKSASVEVWRTPTTGTPNHIPNNLGY